MIPTRGSIQAKLARQRRIKGAFAKQKQICFEQGIEQVITPSEANPQRWSDLLWSAVHEFCAW